MSPVRRCEAGRRATVAVARWVACGLLLSICATAQTGSAATPPGGSALVDFRTPDGSRFLLLPLPGAELVEWAIASPSDAAYDLPGLDGLGAAVVTASLGGTWETGSLDAAKEQVALERLDTAWGQMFATRMGAAAQTELAAARAEAAALGDPRVFRRVLAALPAERVEVVPVGPTTVFAMTTLPEALPELCDLLVERRDRQVLRDLERVWTEELVQRQRTFDANPRLPIYAEVVALALPGHPALRNFERPGLIPPQRRQAMQTWLRTQHPSRTVHALVGSFDPLALRQLLEQKFAVVQVPAEPLPAPVPVRAIATERRSAVPAGKEPVTAFAWQLQGNHDATTALALARWLAGPTGRIAAGLRQRNLGELEVRVQAPWPPALGLAGLVLVEVGGPAKAEQAATLRTAVAAIVAEAAASGPTAAELQRVRDEMVAAEAAIAADRRWLARELAARALRWPGQSPLRAPQQAVRSEALRELANRTFVGGAVIVENTR